MQKKKLKKAQALNLTPIEPALDQCTKELNDVPAKYICAEVLSIIPGFPYQLVEFTLSDRSCVKKTLHENVLNNLQRVVADE